MKIVDHSNSFVDNIKKFDKANSERHYNELVESSPSREDRVRVKGIEINRIDILSVTFVSINFEDCNFIGCNIFKSTFQGCRFINCQFQECRIGNSIVGECEMVSSSISDSMILYTDFSTTDFDVFVFNICHLENSNFGYSSFKQLKFNGSSLYDLRFQIYHTEGSIDLTFLKTSLANVEFKGMRLTSSVFKECSFFSSVFINTEISDKTFSTDNSSQEGDYCITDFQTILKSNIPPSILQKYFGIHNPEVKRYISEIVSKIELHSIFISYSFQDKDFAKRINESLRSKGVITFLWEKDAPGGKRLKAIMHENIQKFDKILFVASKNSLKSEACQYELSEGKKKFEKTWNEVLFPIHIDEYIFEIKEHEIPRTHRGLYYENILELREINSIDFTKFAQLSYEKEAFDSAINALVNDLRKKSQ